jgi:hypothetical protein
VHADADALAKSQIEFIKSMVYSSSNWSYTLAYGETPTGIPDEWASEPELGEEYKGFTVEAQAEDIDIDNNSTDEDGIRKITVRIFHPHYGADAVVTLEDYKRL